MDQLECSVLEEWLTRPEVKNNLGSSVMLPPPEGHNDTGCFNECIFTRLLECVEVGVGVSDQSGGTTDE